MPTAAEPTPTQLATLQLGGGVPRLGGDNRPKVAATSPLRVKAQVWHDVPQYPKQMLQQDEVKQVRQETYVLDLSKAEDLCKYEELQNLEFAENANRYLLAHERRFDEKAGKFIVYAEVGVFKFLEFMPSNLPAKN